MSKQSATAQSDEVDNQCQPKKAIGYTSADPEGDWQRFQNALQHIVSVPKEEVDRAIQAGQEKRSKAKAGT